MSKNFFKNMAVYKSTALVSIEAKELGEKLAQFKRRDCGQLELEAFGFGFPFSRADLFVEPLDRDVLFIQGVRSFKKLNTKAIKKETESRINQEESNLNDTINKKRKDEIKEDVTHEQLAVTLPQDDIVSAYIDTKEGLLVINASTQDKASDFMALLRKALGSLPIDNVFGDDLESALTNTLKERASGENLDEDRFCGIVIGSDCKLCSSDTEEVKLANYEELRTQVRGYLDGGMTCTELRLAHVDGVAFTAHKDGMIKRIRSNSSITESDGESEHDKLISDYTVMVDQFSSVINGLALLMSEFTKPK